MFSRNAVLIKDAIIEQEVWVFARSWSQVSDAGPHVQMYSVHGCSAGGISAHHPLIRTCSGLTEYKVTTFSNRLAWAKFFFSPLSYAVFLFNLKPWCQRANGTWHVPLANLDYSALIWKRKFVQCGSHCWLAWPFPPRNEDVADGGSQARLINILGNLKARIATKCPV